MSPRGDFMIFIPSGGIALPGFQPAHSESPLRQMFTTAPGAWLVRMRIGSQRHLTATTSYVDGAVMSYYCLAYTIRDDVHLPDTTPLMAVRIGKISISTK